MGIKGIRIQYGVLWTWPKLPDVKLVKVAAKTMINKGDSIFQQVFLWLSLNEECISAITLLCRAQAFIGSEISKHLWFVLF